MKSSFDIDAFGHYVSQFQRYYDFSLKMRYSVVDARE